MTTQRKIQIIYSHTVLMTTHCNTNNLHNHTESRNDNTLKIQIIYIVTHSNNDNTYNTNNLKSHIDT